MPEVQLIGWERLIENLDNLAPRLQKNILRGALREGAHEVADAIKERAPLLQEGTLNPHGRYSGQLRDSVRAVDVNPKDTPGAIAAGVKINGTSEGLEQSKVAGRALRKGKLKGAARALAQAMADGYYWRWVEYGSPHNEPPNPFVRAGWDAVKPGILQRIADYIQDRLDKLTHD